jgi:hypothetical protein
MNDFTKEELSMMADGIVFIKSQCKMSDETRNNIHILDEKLCSMIDNYCEHVWTDDSEGTDVCEKCGYHHD